MGVFGGKGGGGGNQTVTNVQALPPELAAPLTAAYKDFNPFQQAFNQVGAFDPQAALAGTAGLSAGEKSAITQAQSLLNTQPAFLTAAKQNLGSLMDTRGTNARLEAQIDDALADVVNNVSSQYALGGRLGSDSFADSLGEGISSGIAPILAQNLQDDKRTQLAAISAAPGLLGADQALISQAAQLGGLARGVDQAGLNALAQQANQQNVLDQNRINALLQAAGLGSGLFGQTETQTQSNNPSFLDQASSAATTAAALAGLFSDQRLKQNITKIGVHKNGLNIYSWDWSETAREFDDELLGSEFGFIAQEAQQVYPEHVYKHSSGYLMLNYEGLGKEVSGVA